jgi:hypothetical protein
MAPKQHSGINHFLQESQIHSDSRNVKLWKHYTVRVIVLFNQQRQMLQPYLTCNNPSSLVFRTLCLGAWGF